MSHDYKVLANGSLIDALRIMPPHSVRDKTKHVAGPHTPVSLRHFSPQCFEQIARENAVTHRRRLQRWCVWPTRSENNSPIAFYYRSQIQRGNSSPNPHTAS